MGKPSFVEIKTKGMEEMKRILLLVLSICFLMLTLIGCGPKNSQDIVGDLSKQAEKMTGYKSKASLSLQTGKTPLEYDVEVWYKQPDLYRIALTSKQNNVTQLILRNAEGVFVLTPHLNKVFRFQSEWPKKNGQVYLYESLVQSIVSDTGRKFHMEGEQYQFEVKAEYQNRSLTSQRIVLNKGLEPLKVEVMDSNMNPMVVVNYTAFEMNPKFDADAFDKERNMQAAVLDSAPAMANMTGRKESKSFGVIEPQYMPKGTELASVNQIKGEESKQIVLRYSGTQPFTIIETKSKAAVVSFTSGEPVDLGYTTGILTGEEKKSLRWDYNGVEYMLSSGLMPKEEMIAVAKSMFDQVGK